MIYAAGTPDGPLDQGDVVDSCPLLFWAHDGDGPGFDAVTPHVSTETVVVLTQACDLANEKSTRVQVAVVHDAEHLVSKGILSASAIRDHVRRHRTFGWYFLPACDDPHVSESIVDLRDLHTLPRELLEEHVRAGRRLASIATPYREHLAQQFSLTYARIALPEPYETQPREQG